jgi:hypothetical protein
MAVKIADVEIIFVFIVHAQILIVLRDSHLHNPEEAAEKVKLTGPPAGLKDQETGSDLIQESLVRIYPHLEIS